MVSHVPAELTPALLTRLDSPCPRYTSYPTADRFDVSFGPESYERALARGGTDNPVSLYIHLPFCDAMCAYCGCNVIVSKSPAKKQDYIDAVLQEMELVAARLPSRRSVVEVHFGGGTPNAFQPEQLAAVLERAEALFDLSPTATLSVEVDPRVSRPGQLMEFADMGLNRLSVGVQDFDPAVQRAVRREQSYEITKGVLTEARAAGFKSVNVDLIYGLPHQTPETFPNTVRSVLELRPDRIALFSFAHVPDVKPNQRLILVDTLPSPDDKLQIFCDARKAFIDAGYVAIGMDHFALPDDTLATRWRAGELGRSFQGYTDHRGCDVLAFGVSAIGEVGGAYVQNTKSLKAYHAAIAEGRLPTERGIELTEEDLGVRFAIGEIMCAGRLTSSQLAPYGMSFDDFPDAFGRLRHWQDEGLVEVEGDGLSVTPLGELFVRLVASAFDRRLHQQTPRGGYSRAV